MGTTGKKLKPNHSTFQPGERHHRWKGGKSISYDGYVRINAGPNRDRFEHNVVMDEMLRDPVSYMLLPHIERPKSEVHHNDHNKRHNCPGNLMLLQRCIHVRISKSYYNYILSHYEEYLEWVHGQEDDEVPF